MFADDAKGMKTNLCLPNRVNSMVKCVILKSRGRIQMMETQVQGKKGFFFNEKMFKIFNLSTE